jgi:hypothetical protein
LVNERLSGSASELPAGISRAEENRLIWMEARTLVPDDAKLKLEYEYDHEGRRIRKKVFTWNGSAYIASIKRREGLGCGAANRR